VTVIRRRTAVGGLARGAVSLIGIIGTWRD
jgi:hypothetical protein